MKTVESAAAAAKVSSSSSPYSGCCCRWTADGGIIIMMWLSWWLCLLLLLLIPTATTAAASFLLPFHHLLPATTSTTTTTNYYYLPQQSFPFPTIIRRRSPFWNKLTDNDRHHFDSKSSSSAKGVGSSGGLLPTVVTVVGIEGGMVVEDVIRRIKKQTSNTNFGHVSASKNNEASRKFRRTVYTFEDWPIHRSPDRFRSGLMSTWKSRIIRGLIKPIGSIAFMTCLLIIWNGLSVGFDSWSGQKRLQPLFPFLPKLAIPMIPFQMTSASLGLLKVFRTNACYGRWDEARKMWGLMINRSRDIVRLGVTWYDDRYDDDSDSPDGERSWLQQQQHGKAGKNVKHNMDTAAAIERRRKERLDKLSKSVWSFSRALARHLTPPEEDEDAFRRDVRARLDPEQAEALIAADHRPNRAMFDIGCAINDLPMHFMRRNQIDSDVTLFEDISGGCERIFSSPLPLVYTRTSARFLALFLLTLPLGMYDAFATSWNCLAMIPSVALVSLFFMGISELAISLEEPFSVLPLMSISNKIGVNCDEIATWEPYTTGPELAAAAESSREPDVNDAGSDKEPSSIQKQSR